MFSRKVWGLCGLCILAATTQSWAVSASDFDDFVGYTIVASMTITGWRDSNGKRGDSFDGCEWGRLIIFDDSKALTCSGYSYSYSYRPKAVILMNGSTIKMVVGNSVYDMRRAP